MPKVAENKPAEQELSIHDQMLGFLDTLPEEEERTPQEPVTEEEEPEEEVEEADSEEVTDEETDEEEDLEGDEEEDNLSEAEGEDEVFEITYNGKTQEVSLSELSNGYLRQADYTRKTQAIAQDRRQLEQERGEITGLRQELYSQLEAFKVTDSQRLEELNRTNWDELKELDPEEYIVKKAEKADLQDRIRQAEDDQRKLAEQHQADMQKAFDAAKSEAQKVLSGPDGIPGWGDPKQSPKIVQALREAGLTLGYTEEELGMAIDHRALKALWMASQFMKGQKLSASAKAKIQRKVPKVTKPGATRVKRAGDKAQKSRQRLHKTGRMDDGARAIYDLLPDDD